MGNEKIEKWSTLKEVQAYLGVGRETILQWIAKRNMPAYKVGKRFRVLGAATRRLNFECLGEVHQLIGSSSVVSSTASTNFSCKCRARLVERFRVLGAAARRLMLLKREKMNRRIKSADFKKK